MSKVYLARVEVLPGSFRDVALKTMRADATVEGTSARDFIEEARLAGAANHPNLVSVREVGFAEEGVFLVMDYVDGVTLEQLATCARGAGERLPVPIAVRILSDLLAGLHAAHDLSDEEGQPLGLVHRDVSPQNVLVGTDGVTRLTDFGIAKARTRESFTRTGAVKGKVVYMSPEQARGQLLDRRSDVWGAGVLAWELLTGRKLRRGETEAASLIALVSERPPRASSVCPDLLPALDDAVASALTLKPADRCSSADELRRRLLNAIRGHEEPADAADVGTFVQRVAGHLIQERRARRAEALSRSISFPGATAVTAVTQQVGPPRPRRSRWKSGGVVGIGIALVALGTMWSLRRTTSEARSEEAPASAVESAPLASPPPSPTASASAAEPAMRARSALKIRANAAIAVIHIGARRLAIEPPAAEVSVDLEEGEREGALDLLVKAADGRGSRLRMIEGQDAAFVEFPAPVRARGEPIDPRAISPFKP
jgi:serine/threonine-protein kinase